MALLAQKGIKLEKQVSNFRHYNHTQCTTTSGTILHAACCADASLPRFEWRKWRSSSHKHARNSSISKIFNRALIKKISSFDNHSGLLFTKLNILSVKNLVSFCSLPFLDSFVSDYDHLVCLIDFFLCPMLFCMSLEKKNLSRDRLPICRKTSYTTRILQVVNCWSSFQKTLVWAK